MLADIAFDVAEFVRQDKGFAVLPQRLPPILAQRMDRHGEEAKFHASHSAGITEFSATRRRLRLTGTPPPAPPRCEGWRRRRCDRRPALTPRARTTRCSCRCGWRLRDRLCPAVRRGG